MIENGHPIGEALHRGCVPEQRKRREMAEAETESRALAFSARRRSSSLPPISSSPLPFLARVRSFLFQKFSFSVWFLGKIFEFNKNRSFVILLKINSGFRMILFDIEHSKV